MQMIDRDLHAFMRSAKALKERGFLEQINTNDLKSLHFEIAEDPDIANVIKEYLKDE